MALRKIWSQLESRTFLNPERQSLAFIMDKEQELIRAVNCGDEEAMREVYETHKAFCMNLAMKYLEDQTEAEDVLQDTFKYFFSKFPGFTLSCRLQTFLFPVVRNLCLSRLRKKKATSGLENIKEPVFESRDPERDRQRVEDMVANLAVEHRDVILMRFADQLSLEDISQRLAIPKGTVKSRLHNALKKLRDHQSFIWLISFFELADF